MLFNLDRPGWVPEVYRDSRDYRVFLKLLGILLTIFKKNIDNFPELYSPDNCPDELLPLLAGMVGYPYDDGISVDDNRIIIKYFPYMLRYRGSEEGIKLATALSLNTSDDKSHAYTLDSIIVEFDPETGMITIYYPHVDVLRKELLEFVRPVGTVLNLIPSYINMTNDELDIKVRVKAITEKYRKYRQEVDKSKVGLGNTDIMKDGGDQ